MEDWPARSYSLSPFLFSCLTGTGSVRCGPGGVEGSAPPSPTAEGAGTHVQTPHPRGTGH